VSTAVANRPVARPALGAAMVVAAATVWGLNGTVSKLLIQGGFDPPQLTAFRAAGAALGLLLFILVTRGPRPLAARPREIPRLVGYGLIGVFSVPLLYFVAISRLPVGIGLLFEFTAPVFVALWVRFGEHEPDPQPAADRSAWPSCGPCSAPTAGCGWTVWGFSPAWVRPSCSRRGTSSAPGTWPDHRPLRPEDQPAPRADQQAGRRPRR
jgi:uncharacterized membrane protein